MAAIGAIKGLDNLVSKLRAKVAAAIKDGNTAVVVGYTASYALYVHEDPNAAHGQDFNVKYKDRIARVAKLRKQKKITGQNFYHSRGPQQQYKFLETPARELRKTLGMIIKAALIAKKTMAQALLLAGLKLQRASQEIVPVDLGDLRASAFTSIERLK